MIITANDVKKKGIGIFDKFVDEFCDVILTVRGKKKYVVMDIQRYEKIRAYELDIAYKEIQEDIKNKDFHTDLQKHIKMIENV